jgi:hypothetical protein
MCIYSSIIGWCNFTISLVSCKVLRVSCKVLRVSCEVLRVSCQ